MKINVVFLPPYSPDFNPIEKMWAKIKAILRKLKVRDIGKLKSAIDYAFKQVSADNSVEWFDSCFVG